MKRLKIRCPYCGSLASKRHASVVYGEKASKNSFLYICDRYPKCNSYVAAHRDSGLPMGTLANESLRKKRIAAHKALNKICNKGFMTKEQVYIWLQSKFSMTEKQMHIGNFDEYYCNQVIFECNKAFHNMRLIL